MDRYLNTLTGRKEIRNKIYDLRINNAKMKQ